MNKMKYFWLLATVAVSMAMSGCGANVATNSTANNANSAAKNSTTAVESNTKSEPPASNSAPTAAISLATPTDAYNAAYEYRKSKNIEGLKKVMSKDVLEFFTEMGKAENKTLDDMLRELCDKPQAPTNVTRNLNIKGNTATLQYPDEDGTDWTTMDFVKEGSDWKMTIPEGPEKSSDGPKKP